MMNIGLYWNIRNIKLSSRNNELEEFLTSNDNERIFKLGKSFIDSDDFIDSSFVASAYGGYVWDDLYNPLYPLQLQLREWARSELKKKPWIDIEGVNFSNYRIAIYILYHTGYEEQDILTALNLMNIEGFYNHKSEDFLKTSTNYVTCGNTVRERVVEYYLAKYRNRLNIDNITMMSNMGGEMIIHVYDGILYSKNKQQLEDEFNLKLHDNLSKIKAEILFSGIWSENPSFSKHFKERAREFIEMYDHADKAGSFENLPMNKEDYDINQLKEDLEFFTQLDIVITKLQNPEVNKDEKMDAYNWVAQHQVFSSLKDRFSAKQYRHSFTKDITPFLFREFLSIHSNHYQNLCALYKDLEIMVKDWETEDVSKGYLNAIKEVYEYAENILKKLIEERQEEQLPILFLMED